MIKIQIASPHIIQGAASEIDLEIVNQSDGLITHLLFDVGIPVVLLLIKGGRRVEIPRLEAGQSYHHRLVVRGKTSGTYSLQIQGLSFRGPDGRIHDIGQESLPLEVVASDQKDARDSIQLQFAMEPCSLKVDEWSDLKGQVFNPGGTYLPDLRIFLDGPVTCEPLLLTPLPPGGRAAFSLPVLPSLAGERVPAILRVLSPSGANLFAARVFLRVAGKQAGASTLPGGLVIQGSQVEITYGDRSSIDVAGDAVMLNHGRSEGKVSPGPLLCPQCGKKISREAKFCEACGNKLS